SLGGLSRAANLDKGQMSRVISSLVKRGFVTRDKGARKGVVVHLSLTPPGRQLYSQLIAIAGERNDRFAACPTPQERAALLSALPKLFETARYYLRESIAPDSSRASATSKRQRPLNGSRRSQASGTIRK